jgi:hypothetical protein
MELFINLYCTGIGDLNHHTIGLHSQTKQYLATVTYLGPSVSMEYQYKNISKVGVPLPQSLSLVKQKQRHGKCGMM